jgi:hypothetical protein
MRPDRAGDHGARARASGWGDLVVGFCVGGRFAWRVFAVGEARDGCGERLGSRAVSRRACYVPCSAGVVVMVVG